MQSSDEICSESKGGNLITTNGSNIPIDVNIVRSELQNKRAAKKTSFNSHIGNKYMGSFSFFGGLQTNPQTNPSKGEAEVTDLNHLPLSTTSPINLARQCVNAQIEKDNSIPTLYEILSVYMIDNYNFNPNKKSNPFNRFEKVNFFGIPENLLDSNIDSLVTNMGIIPEIKRAWLSADNKLYIWNYNASLTDQEFDVIDDFSGTILTCAIVKPKDDVFVPSVNHLLVVATSKEIKILALEFDTATNKLEISDTKMSVSVHGLIVNKIVFFEKTKDILFTGAGSGDAIWKLNYSNSNDWFSKSTTKELLTNLSLSSSLPNIPIFNWLNDSVPSNSESIIDLKIDQTRNIIYTLSSKSIIKAYKFQLKDNQIKLGEPIVKSVNRLLKELSTTATNIRSPLLRSNLNLISIYPVTKKENENLFLVAIASNGCRFFINGSTLYGNRLTLTTNFVKFPPIDLNVYETIEKRREKMVDQNQPFNNDELLLKKIQSNNTPFYQFNKTTANRQYAPSNRDMPNSNSKSITKSSSLPLVSIEELKEAQESSQLLKNTSNGLIISPGIFIGYSKSIGLYTSTPDYGIFKKASQYIEDFEILGKFSNVFDIVQITPSFNAVNKPKGYANEFASQYTSGPLEFAVLTSSGIVVYRYRTPDLILEDSMNDHVFKQFAMKYGSDEACSTSLYLACKYDKSDTFRNLATKYFISGGQNSRLDKSLSAVIDNVELSDRYFGVLLLFSRLIRDVWNKEVFKLRPEIKFDRSGYIDTKSVKSLKTDKQLILEGLNIDKKELEYLLCSILIVIKFFEDNRNIIPGLSKDINTQSESTSWKEKANEVCIQAEQICFDSMSKFLNITKEGLSFLTILLEEDDSEDSEENRNKNFKSIVSFLPLQLQADLSCVTFSDFFAKSDANVSKLIKELLSCIINKSISQGNSVELVANTLQEKCGYFCSTGDVLIFKAIENLKKAKVCSDNKDDELKLKHLENSLKLLKQTSDTLSDETIADCVNTVLQLGYYPDAIQFLLDIANTPELVKLATQYQNDMQLSIAVDPIKKNSYQRKLKLYHIIFQILVDIDKKALSSVEHASDVSIIGQTTFNGYSNKSAAPVFVDQQGHLVTYYSQLRDKCYKICLNYKDKMFHFEFYKWFVANGVGEKLLYVETPYILEFLKLKAANDLEMSKLLWLYYSKKGDYYEAANHLYALSMSSFNISLEDRIQFLSIANSFIQVIESQFLKKDVMNLASRISDLISVSGLQDELLSTILQDSRVNDVAKKIAKEELGGEILVINDLYNDYIDPLGYYELALICFKLSDYRNLEDVLSKWESLFDKWYVEYKEKENHENDPFYISQSNSFVIIANRLKDIESLFPILTLLNLMFKNVYTHLNKNTKVEPGIVVDAFIKSGISYSKLYYNLRKLIESTTYELFEGYTDVINSEMCYLLQKWYKTDKKLREIIFDSSMRNITKYDLNNDPLYKYMKSTGNPL